MPSGTLILRFQGKDAAWKPYHNNPEKRVAIHTWERLYGPMFKNCIVIDNEDPKSCETRERKKSIPEYGNIKGNGGRITKSHMKTKVL